MTFKAAPISRTIWKSTGKTFLIVFTLIVGMGYLQEYLDQEGKALSIAQLQSGLTRDGIPLSAMLLFFYLCRIRSYERRGDCLVVRRGLWQTRVLLGDVQEAVTGEEASRKMEAAFGYSGYFAIVGRIEKTEFWSKRAYVSDPERCILLIGTKGEVFISPENAEAFLAEVEIGKPSVSPFAHGFEEAKKARKAGRSF